MVCDVWNTGNTVTLSLCRATSGESINEGNFGPGKLRTCVLSDLDLVRRNCKKKTETSRGSMMEIAARVCYVLQTDFVGVQITILFNFARITRRILYIK